MKVLSLEQKVQKEKRRLIITIIAIILAGVLLTTAAIVWYYWQSPADIPEQITVTVAWNPGSIADDVVRVMYFGETQLVLQNIPGTHGAMGLNAVFNQEHDGTSLLSTSLSAFHEVNEMGFAESTPEDWTWWIVAYSPEYDDYYGLFVPASVPKNRLRGLDSLISEAVLSDEFTAFLEKSGLEAVTPKRG